MCFYLRYICCLIWCFNSFVLFSVLLVHFTYLYSNSAIWVWLELHSKYDVFHRLCIVYCLKKTASENQLDEQCQRTSSASKRATVSTRFTHCTRIVIIDSSATMMATRWVVRHSKRTYDDHSAEQQIKFRVYLLARLDNTTDSNKYERWA